MPRDKFFVTYCKKDVSAEALRLAGQITKEKDEEIQQLRKS